MQYHAILEQASKTRHNDRDKRKRLEMTLMCYNLLTPKKK